MADSTNAAPDTEAVVRFARRVSHVINYFSTVVRTYSELLLSDVNSSDPMYADIEEIHRASDATVVYLQRVTLFSRAENMRRAVTSADNGIADAVAQLATEHGARPVELSLGGGHIFAEAGWWRDTVMELLRNAHEAAPAGHAIVVRSRVEDNTVVVDVEDDGPGIPAELLGTVTQPFVTGKHGVRGAGIGLAIVDAFVRVLEGRLLFEREAGRTRVRVELPTVSGG
ncbi:MAG: HAMP domain-containing sensor histidine kinase [Gemmatimonadota bacterium]|nr:HAMP domain-containing sensor histidine kinase [Gemmatimonadota bacterium]